MHPMHGWCFGVASLAGAWIETRSTKRSSACATSPPSRGRGSKPAKLDPERRFQQSRLPRGGVDRNWPEGSYEVIGVVASLAGAWIETSRKPLTTPSTARRLPRGGVDRNAWQEPVVAMGLLSPPSRGRGSKPVCNDVANKGIKSPPSRGRGSKPAMRPRMSPARLSPPSRGRGSKLCLWRCNGFFASSPPSRGRGSKPPVLSVLRLGSRRLPRGGVDRNTGMRAHSLWTGVASLAGAWIETGKKPRMASSGGSRLPRGGVDRNASWTNSQNKRYGSPPSRGRRSKHQRRGQAGTV